MTNFAAAIAHCCIPQVWQVWQFVSISSVFNSLHAFVIRGKCVFLMYDWQEVRKCTSVSSCVQCLSSLGIQVCLWHPFSMARLCSLSLYLVK